MPRPRVHLHRRADRSRGATQLALATGWSFGPGARVVVAIVPTEYLPRALSIVHQRGFGSSVRVVDSARGNMTAQLERLGIGADIYPASMTVDGSFVLVIAPGREIELGDLLLEAGASDVRVVQRPLPGQAGTSVFDRPEATIEPHGDEANVAQ